MERGVMSSSKTDDISRQWYLNIFISVQEMVHPGTGKFRGKYFAKYFSFGAFTTSRARRPCAAYLAKTQWRATAWKNHPCLLGECLIQAFLPAARVQTLPRYTFPRLAFPPRAHAEMPNGCGGSLGFGMVWHCESSESLKSPPLSPSSPFPLPLPLPLGRKSRWNKEHHPISVDGTK